MFVGFMVIFGSVMFGKKMLRRLSFVLKINSICYW